MNRYIEQLIEGFNDSTSSVAGLMGNRRHPIIPRLFEEDVESAKFILLRKYLNIQPVQFPPTAQLEDSDLILVNDAFTKLLYAYGFLTHFPNNVSPRLKYERLTALLEREVPILMHHYWRIPTCDLDADNCLFGLEYCTCF